MERNETLDERTDFRELKMLIIICSGVLVILAAYAVNFYLSLPSHEVVRSDEYADYEHPGLNR